VFIKKQRWNWLGHVKRMAEDNVCRRLRDGNPWLKDQLEDLKQVGKMTFGRYKGHKRKQLEESTKEQR